MKMNHSALREQREYRSQFNPDARRYLREAAAFKTGACRYLPGSELHIASGSPFKPVAQFFIDARQHAFAINFHVSRRRRWTF